MLCNFLLIEFFAIIFTFVNGSHFLGGTIIWHPLNSSATGSPVAIVITQTYSWTWTADPCSNTDMANSHPVPFITNYAGISNTLNCVLNCGTAIGFVAPNIWSYCTDFSTVESTTVGQRSDIVYINTGEDFTVAFSSTAWRPLATAGSADWSLASHIILTPRSDNGLYNNAPSQPKAINIPISDADGDPMRCRWASSTTECGQVCPPGSLPNDTIIFPNCTIIITGTVIGDLFAVTVVVEDFINSSSTTPLSSVPIQFLVEIVAPPPCTILPEVYELSEAPCTPIIVGQTYTSQIIAINYCGANVNISDIVTLPFPGMIRGNLIQYNSTVYYATISWTPTINQLGYQVTCAMAVDRTTTTSTTTTITTSTSTSTSTTTTATTSTTTTLPCSLGIFKENGPFELYRIERCINRECQWPFVTDSPNITLPANADNDLVHDIFNEHSINSTMYLLGLSTSIEPNTHLQASMKMDSIKSRYKVSELNMDSSVQKEPNSGTVRMSRLKSSKLQTSAMLNNALKPTNDAKSNADPKNGIRVTCMPSPLLPICLSSTQNCSPSIIDNTIRLDENDETQPTIGSLKQNKDKIHVTRIRSSHRRSALAYHPSQIETIEIPSINHTSKFETLSTATIRVERIHKEKKQSKSRSVAPFELIFKEITNETKELPEKSTKPAE
ncbi:unnamed protein product [Rotaria socialis]|uniref:Uncharacterized protein n=1 Tax=Rotaria socialis TaxID=392032 RepID=A0A820MP88_9BILA|nr:unnamed protein product [Rotaria socialis]CAF4376956.1 unnamed protein product [Rotaria socialis]